MRHQITTLRDLRAAFWREHPDLQRRKIPNYRGDGLMHCTDTRTAWVNYVDHMARHGAIPETLAQRATL